MTTPQQRWDEKYADRPGMTEPTPMLDEIAELLPVSGTVVDVAGGTGRNARWFARRGYATTIIDTSAVGLAHAAMAADVEGLSIECVHRDLERDGMPSDRRFDIAFMYLYFDLEVLRRLSSSLSPDGLLIFGQPTLANLERHEKPPAQFLLAPGEIRELAASIPETEQVLVSEGWRSTDRHEGWMVLRRRR